MKYLFSVLLFCSFEALACSKDKAFKMLDADSVSYAKAYLAVARTQNWRIETADRYIEKYDFWISGSIIRRLGTMILSTTKDCQYYTANFIPKK
jgi:hypothetical protein